MFEHHIIVEICWEVHGPSVLEPGAIHDQGDLCEVWHNAGQDEMILLAILCPSCKYFISENFQNFTRTAWKQTTCPPSWWPCSDPSSWVCTVKQPGGQGTIYSPVEAIDNLSPKFIFPWVSKTYSQTFYFKFNLDNHISEQIARQFVKISPNKAAIL